MGLFVISDEKKQVEHVLDQEGFHMTSHIDDHLELNLTKEEAYQIAERYRENLGILRDPIDDIENIEERVMFYNSIQKPKDCAMCIQSSS